MLCPSISDVLAMPLQVHNQVVVEECMKEATAGGMLNQEHSVKLEPLRSLQSEAIWGQSATIIIHILSSKLISRKISVQEAAGYSGALRTGSMAFEARLWQNLDQLYAK